MWRWRNRMGVSCGRVMSACIMPCMPSTPWCSVPSHPVMCYLNRSMHKHPLNQQAEDPCHSAYLYVEQLIARICVHLSPRPQVFRHCPPCRPSTSVEIPFETTRKEKPCRTLATQTQQAP